MADQQEQEPAVADGEAQKATEQTEAGAQRAAEAGTLAPTAEEGVPEVPDAAVKLTRQASVSWVFVVAGHPDPSYNGEYRRCGTWNDRPAYRLAPGRRRALSPPPVNSSYISEKSLCRR